MQLVKRPPPVRRPPFAKPLPGRAVALPLPKQDTVVRRPPPGLSSSFRLLRQVLVAAALVGIVALGIAGVSHYWLDIDWRELGLAALEP